MKYSLIGNANLPINSIRNLQRKLNRQQRRMIILDVWSQVFCPRKNDEN
jgi:hypothetical protein